MESASELLEEAASEYLEDYQLEKHLDTRSEEDVDIQINSEAGVSWDDNKRQIYAFEREGSNQYILSGIVQGSGEHWQDTDVAEEEFKRKTKYLIDLLEE